MSDYSKTVKYRFNRELNDYDISYLHSKIPKIDGIESCTVSKTDISVELMTLKLAPESVSEMILNLGYPVKTERSKKPGLFKRFLDNLAKSNKESFGSKKLDCCDLKH